MAPIRSTAFPTHELVWATGDDIVSFLDGLLSQHVAGLEPGVATRSFLLAPNGKLRALLWVLPGSGAVGLIADYGLAATVVGDLNRFKLRVNVELTTPIALHSTIGDTTGGWTIEGEDVQIPVPLGEMPRLLSASVDPDVPELTRRELDALRIDACEPVMGVDVDESTIPQETGLVAGAVDFSKGCYLGQELVARIDSRGHVNRRLASVVLDDAVTPVPGADVLGSSGDSVGALTSVAPGKGMGLIRREVGSGERVEVTWDTESAVGLVHDVHEFAPR
jgi:folate-binding protein YgfZ